MSEITAEIVQNQIEVTIQGGLGASVDEKVKASSSDSSGGYLDSKVDNITIEVSSNKLQVIDGYFALSNHSHNDLYYTESEVDTLLSGKANTAHSHVETDITDLDKYTQSEVDTLLSGKANTAHTHTESQITDLQAYLLDITAEPLGDLSDVTITTIGAGEVLMWSGTAWINRTLSEASIASSNHTHSTSVLVSGQLDDARLKTSNVTQFVASIDHNSLLNYNIAQHRTINDAGSATTDLWSADKIISMLSGKANTSHTHVEADITDLQGYLLDITGESLEDLSNVSITTIASGELLKWNGSSWVNNTLAEAGIAPTSHTHTKSQITDLGAYIENIVEDTTPQLGGNLDANGHTITNLDASTTAKGIVELATSAETTTGTDTARAITPDGLAGSDYGKRVLALALFESDTDVAVGDGKVGIPVTPEINGYNIVNVIAFVHSQGVTGSLDVQIRRRRSGSDADVLSTKVTVGAEYYAQDGTINTSNDDLATGDMLFADVDAIHSGTAPKGLTVAVIVQKP